MRQRGALFCLTGWHEYLIFLLPYGRDFRLTCKGMKPYFFLPCRCVFLPPRREQHILLFFPYGSDVSPSGEVGTPARRAARWGRLWGCAPFIPMPNPVLRALGRHRRRCRRAVRHENQSLTARQSRDLLLISGRVDVANTPPGLRPFCPLASPPKHPIRGASNFPSVARARVLCCGSYPPSLRSLS